MYLSTIVGDYWRNTTDLLVRRSPAGSIPRLAMACIRNYLLTIPRLDVLPDQQTHQKSLFLPLDFLLCSQLELRRYTVVHPVLFVAPFFAHLFEQIIAVYSQYTHNSRYQTMKINP
jgi:hypothetical protein